jgi:transcriptional/translational regulatory protein YebC/TACO1
MLGLNRNVVELVDYTDEWKELYKQEALKNVGITEFTVAELTMLAHNEMTISEEAHVQLEKLIDALEDLEDVQHVHHNVEHAD